MKKTTYIVTWIAIVMIFVMGIYAMGEHFSMQGIGVLFVIAIPYILGMWALMKLHQSTGVKLLSWTMILLSFAGIYLIADGVLMHPTAQSSMIFMVLPLFVFPVVMIAGVVSFVIERNMKS